jgi:acyl-CoA synthetase (AMP-forming)/AMP-acid ligase II
MSSSPTLPPLDGSITVLPGFVDFYARYNPDCEWTRLAADGDGPVTSLSFREFADATHRIARIFRPDGVHVIGEVVAVLIHCDTILYLALLVGLVRAGFVVSSLARHTKSLIPTSLDLHSLFRCHPRTLSLP